MILKFLENPHLLSSNDAFVAHLSDIGDKNRLLVELSNVLKLPDYFGFNWDALSDCLRDFHWIKQKDIILVHDEIPRLNNKDFTSYLEVLTDAVQDWGEDDQHRLTVIFPLKDENLIRQYLER